MCRYKVREYARVFAETGTLAPKLSALVLSKKFGTHKCYFPLNFEEHF